MPSRTIALVQQFLTEREQRSFNKSIFVKIIPKRERPGCFLANSSSPCFAEREKQPNQWSLSGHRCPDVQPAPRTWGSGCFVSGKEITKTPSTYGIEAAWSLCKDGLVLSLISGLWKSSQPDFSKATTTTVGLSNLLQFQGLVFKRVLLAALPFPAPPHPTSSTLPRHSLSAGLHMIKERCRAVYIQSDCQCIHTHSVSVQCPVTTRWGGRGCWNSCCLSWKSQALSTICLYIHNRIRGPSIRGEPCSCLPIRPASFLCSEQWERALHSEPHRMADLIKSPTLIMLGRGVEFQWWSIMHDQFVAMAT